ncbi:MAG: methyl-accepting chemotaxis protein [Myxococcota bacterium]
MSARSVVSSPALTDSAYDAFRRRLMTTMSGVCTVLALVLTLVWVAVGVPYQHWIFLPIGGCATFASLLLARRNRIDASIQTLVFGATFLCVLYRIELGSLTRLLVEVLIVLAVLSAALAPRRSNLVFAGLVTAFLLLSTYIEARHASAPSFAWGEGIGDLSGFVAVWLATTVVAHHLRANDQALRARLLQIDDVVARADRIATGDLSAPIEADDTLSTVIRRMTRGLRGIVVEVHEGVRILGSSSTQVESMTARYERGATQQAAAAQQTSRTIEAVTAQARTIAETSSSVLANAESTLANSELALERMKRLHEEARRIEQLLETISAVARRSEVLALNAALEGSRAGAAGRGFSLVASHMKDLAASTSDAVADVKELTASISTSTQETALAVEATTNLAAGTARSARAIAGLTDEQRTTLNQVVDASSEIARVADEFVAGVKDTRQAVEGLNQLAGRLDDVAHRFVV